jgi:hypothetical protein
MNALDRTKVRTSLSEKMKELHLWGGVIIHEAILLKWMDNSRVHLIGRENIVLNIWSQNASKFLSSRLCIKFVRKTMCVS